jgi:hypothetical protein
MTGWGLNGALNEAWSIGWEGSWTLPLDPGEDPGQDMAWAACLVALGQRAIPWSINEDVSWLLSVLWTGVA